MHSPDPQWNSFAEHGGGVTPEGSEGGQEKLCGWGTRHAAARAKSLTQCLRTLRTNYAPNEDSFPMQHKAGKLALHNSILRFTLCVVFFLYGFAFFFTAKERI